MKKALIFVCSLAVLPPTMGCKDGARETSILTPPPLTEPMSFQYEETLDYKGKTYPPKAIEIKFEKKEDGTFVCVKTITDQYGTYTDDPLAVDGYFRYNKVMDTLAGNHPLWRDPRLLASGNIGRMKVEADIFNGESVYACLVSDHQKEYYEMESGILEGGYIDLGDKKESINRVR